MKRYLDLTFGGTIERATGTASVPLELMYRAENVLLGRSKVYPRGGLLQTADLSADYLALVAASRVRNEGIEAAVTGTTVTIHRTAGDGTSPLLLGTWLDPHLSVETFRAMAAEMGGKVFVAHEEQGISRRGHTVYYDPATDDTTFFILTADWAFGDLTQDTGDPGYDATNGYVRFRGVTAWLDYLVGWGFGTNEVDAPEMVRISDPEDPRQFTATSWVRAGQRGDPVIACLPTPAGLLVYKEAETYVIRGDSRAEFGIFLLDQLFGLAAPRLAVVVGGTSYAWSLQGPRRSAGGVSEDISWPLGLPWPTAEDVASEGRILSGFAAYDPDHRQVLFVFEDWVYAFSIEDEKWSHWRMMQKVHAGGVLYPASGYVGTSRGYPSYTSAGTPNTTTSIFARYQNNLAEGDETVEVWYRPQSGTWVQGPNQSVNAATPEFEITGLTANTVYEVAFRYLRGGVASPGYDGSPSLWPSVSRGFETTADDGGGGGGADPTAVSPYVDGGPQSAENDTTIPVLIVVTKDEARTQYVELWSLETDNVSGVTLKPWGRIATFPMPNSDPISTNYTQIAPGPGHARTVKITLKARYKYTDGGTTYGPDSDLDEILMVYTI